jgi:hypothetical protein
VGSGGAISTMHHRVLPIFRPSCHLQHVFRVIELVDVTVPHTMYMLVGGSGHGFKPEW